jgi:predicted Zn-dependent peptidase
MMPGHVACVSLRFSLWFFGLLCALLSHTHAAGRQAPAAVPADAAAPPQFQRFQLASGVRLVLVRAPQAKRQTTFTFLPITLVNDDAGRAQWSHLLEHMLIRTTDAEGLAAEGMIFNGETTHTYLRLETMAKPDHWKVALERHARWLNAREFDAQRLEREKGMITQEEQSTAVNGFTGKFALAAWNQVVSHGLAHAAVHNDVQNAEVADVNAYAARHVRLDDSVLIASIGPVPVEEVRAAIEHAIVAPDQPMRGDDVRAVDPAAPAPAASQPVAPRMRHATWDLPTRHALFWWPLPDRRPQTFAAATAVSRALHMRFMSDRERAKLVWRVIPLACVSNDAGTFMIFDACLNADSDPQQVALALAAVTAELADPASATAKQSIVFGGRMASQESPLAIDFAALAQQLPPHLKDCAEGLWLLGLMNIEYACNAPAEEAQPMLSALDDQAVAEILSRLKMPASSLLLEPK